MLLGFKYSLKSVHELSSWLTVSLIPCPLEFPLVWEPQR